MGKQLVEDHFQTLMAERAQIGGLGVADDLKPQRLKVIEEARKLQTRTHDLLDHELDLVVIRRSVARCQIEFLHDLPQRDAVRVHRHIEYPPDDTIDCIIYDSMRICNLSGEF